MKKIFLLATAAFLITSVSFADGGKKHKGCAKGKSCCKGMSKSCCKDKSKTVSM